MNKNQVLSQIRSEMAAEENTRNAKRDEAFFKAYLKDRTLTKAKFLACHCASEASASSRLEQSDVAIPRLTQKQRYTQKLIEQSNFKSTAPNSFKKPPTPGHEKIYSLLAQYCDKFPNTSKSNIVLSGATGTGKTYAVHIIANNLLSKGFSILYVTSFGLVERFKKYINTFGDETETDALFDCDLLVIDDLGTEPTIKNITQEYLYNVINERLANNKAFVITTNLDPSALFEKYDQRIASRILSKESSVVIEFNSKDLRLS